MADERRGYKHDASDKALDRSAEATIAAAQSTDTESAGAGHDPAEIRQHDDAGKDRLFEDRQQHDYAEKNSEKTRLARDVARHDHPADDDAAGSSAEPDPARKN